MWAKMYLVLLVHSFQIYLFKFYSFSLITYAFIYLNVIVFFHIYLLSFFALSAGTAEYTACIPQKGKTPTKQSDGEDPVILELWEIQNSPLLPSLPGPRRTGEVAPDELPSTTTTIYIWICEWLSEWVCVCVCVSVCVCVC